MKSLGATRRAKRWRQAGPWLVALMLILVAIYALKSSYFPELPARGDALYDLIVARQLIEGHGFRTNLMPLGGLGVLERSGHLGEMPWPSVHKFVGSQIRVALHVAIFRDPITSLRASSLVPYAALVALLFLTMRRLLASAPLGFLFAALFMCMNEHFNFALSGLSVSADSLLFFALVVLMLSAHANRFAIPALAVVLPLVVFHRYSLAILVPFCLAGVAWSAGWRRSLIIAIPTVLMLGGFIAWSKWRFGLTFPSYLGESLLLHRTPYLPYDPWYVLEWPSASGLVRRDPGTFVAKFGVSLRTAYDIFTAGPAPLARSLAVLGLAVVGARRLCRASKSVKRVILTLVAFAIAFSTIQLCLSAAIWYLAYLFAPIWVLAALGAVTMIRWLGRRAPALRRAGPRFAACLVCGLFFVIPEVARAKSEHDWFANASRRCADDELCNRAEVVSVVRGVVDQKTILMGGTLPWELAAETVARVIPILPRPEDLVDLRAKGFTVDAVFLPGASVFAGDGDRPVEWYRWRRIVQAAPERFFDYVLQHRFSDGSLLYLRDAKLEVSAAIPTCAPSTIDLHRPLDMLALSKEFPYRETYEDRAWSWLHGTTGRIRLELCETGAASRVTLVYMTANNEVDVSLNGTSLGRAKWTETGWRTSTLALPSGLLHQGVNELVISATSASSPGGTSIALESIAFE